MTTPLTPEERAALRDEHRKDRYSFEPELFCQADSEDWPCRTIRLLDELDEAWAAVEATR